MSDDINVDEEYERFKNALADCEHLFQKLHRIGLQYEAIDFDESGLYREQEAKVLGRWEKLVQKLCDALSVKMQECRVMPHQNKMPDAYCVSMDIKCTETETFRVRIDYADIEGLKLLKET